MALPDPEFIPVLLKSVTFPRCVEWLKGAPDDHVCGILTRLLCDQRSGELHQIEDGVLREQLLRTAREDEAFCAFLNSQLTAALDRITADYLEKQMEGLC